MHEITVCKFGGSSLADAACFRRVADIIRSDRKRRYIIVSAPGKCAGHSGRITDMLIRAHALSGGERRRILDKVRSRFMGISAELGIPAPESELEKLESHTTRDALASRGEQLCALILAKYMDIPYIDSADIFIFGKGHIDVKKTYENMRELPYNAVIPGFYGADENGGIVTFPRGGSDISAAHAAAGVGAHLYENWTDVDGFFTADPLIVKNARHIDRLSYEQAQLYAYLGAGVLHYDSIAPAADANIPILVRNTFHPMRLGTLIYGGGNCRLPMIARRALSGGAYLLSAANLTPAMRSRARDILGGGVEHCGMLCAECGAGTVNILTEKLHDALTSLL